VKVRTAPASARTVEQDVLLLCARSQLEGAASERLSRLLNEALDWDSVVAQAGYHHVSALLYHHLSSVAPAKVPPPVLAGMRTRYLLLAARNLRLVGETVPLLKALESAGAPAVVWKGPALAYSVYPSPELRTFTDLDLLVRREDVGTVRAVLTSLGYLPRLSPGVSEEEVFGRMSRAVTMVNPESGGVLDIHWGSAQRYLSSAMDGDRLWTRSGPLDVEGTTVQVLDREPMLLALCAHGAKHGPFPWPTLKWITDIEAVVKAHPPDRWGPILARARELGCLRMLLLGLHLANDLLEVSLPREVVEELGRDPVVGDMGVPIRERILEPNSVPFPFSERLRFDLRVRERYRDRFRYAIVRVLTPSKQDRSSTPASLRPLLVVTRLLRLGRRYLLNPARGKAFLLGPTQQPKDTED